MASQRLVLEIQRQHNHVVAISTREFNEGQCRLIDVQE